MIIHWRKDKDYFTVRVYQDLVGDWIITQSWGNSLLEQSSFKHTVASSYQEARGMLKQISQQRKKLGFQPHKRKETQLGFEFLEH